MKQGQQVRLTEQDLHMIVEDAVMNILRENGMEEGGWGALFGAGRQAAQNKWNNFKQGAMNLGQNIQATYKAGRTDAQVQKSVKNVRIAVDNLMKIASRFPDLAELVNSCRQFDASMQNLLNSSAKNLQKAQANTFNTQNPNQQ